MGSAIGAEATDAPEQFANFGFTVPDLADQFAGIGVQTQNDVNHTVPSPRRKMRKYMCARAHNSHKNFSGPQLRKNKAPKEINLSEA
jgi:hypothetical protein